MDATHSNNLSWHISLFSSLLFTLTTVFTTLTIDNWHFVRFCHNRRCFVLVPCNCVYFHMSLLGLSAVSSLGLFYVLSSVTRVDQSVTPIAKSGGIYGTWCFIAVVNCITYSLGLWPSSCSWHSCTLDPLQLHALKRALQLSCSTVYMFFIAFLLLYSTLFSMWLQFFQLFRTFAISSYFALIHIGFFWWKQYIAHAFVDMQIIQPSVPLSLPIHNGRFINFSTLS